jgi:hypothetical protein
MNRNSSITHETIARRAYQIWEEAGRHDGTETTHWLQAEKELYSQHDAAGKTKADPARPVEPPVSGKHVPEHASHSTNYVHPGVTTDSLHHVRNR